MKYEVTVKDVTLDEASQIIREVSRMGFVGISMIAESPKQHDVPDVVSDMKPRRRIRRGKCVVLKGSGRKFISMLDAFRFVKENCGVACSVVGLKKAIENRKPYMGFDFMYDKTNQGVMP